MSAVPSAQQEVISALHNAADRSHQLGMRQGEHGVNPTMLLPTQIQQRCLHCAEGGGGNADEVPLTRGDILF